MLDSIQNLTTRTEGVSSAEGAAIDQTGEMVDAPASLLTEAPHGR
jgi:hypothetical protein